MSLKHHRQNPTRRKQSVVYIVLQRSFTVTRHEDEHDVSCVSLHRTLPAANEAAKQFFGLEDEDDDDVLEKEDGWSSWEDLAGERMQTDEAGKVRLIRRMDMTREEVVWVERKLLKDEHVEAGEHSTRRQDERRGDASSPKAKRLKTSGDSPSDIIDLTSE